jgi:prefoldin subunit 5
MPLDQALKKWIEARITTVDEEIEFLQTYIGTLPRKIVDVRIVKHQLEKMHLEEWLRQQGVLIKKKPSSR